MGRLLPILLLLLPLGSAFALESNASQEASITRFLYLNASASCPGNVLLMNATASDGLPAYDVELRLVLYLPYQGLRALQHTDENGLASVELTKNGSYRIYIGTDRYEHEKYVEFEYPLMCPPPPPKQMNVAIAPDCEDMRLRILAASNETGAPLDGVFILAENWSSFTGQSGEVLVPFEKGYVFIRAERANYTPREFYFDARCLPPPECLSDGDCDALELCEGGNCTNVTGECGYPDNHTWVAYACCEDADCGNGSMICTNNSCVEIPLPLASLPSNITSLANLTNQTNATGNESGADGEEMTAGACAGALILAAGMLLLRK